MRVDRIMAVMRDKDSVKGYIKAEKIGDNVTINMSLNDAIDGLIVVIRIDNESHVVPYERLTSGYQMTASSQLQSISALVMNHNKNSIYALGSSEGYVDTELLKSAYVDHIAKNSDTYIGVKSHLYGEESNIVEFPTLDVTESDEAESQTIAVSDKDSIDADKSDNIVLGKNDDRLYSHETPFYSAISGQLNDLFSRYEHENVLENAISGSMFAKIFYEDTKYYVVGEIRGEDGTPELICYGYPGEGGQTPPKEVEGSYEWLPLDRNNEESQGYYMMYQNAVTGEIITN